MDSYLSRLAARALGRMPVIQPVIHARFEPQAPHSIRIPDGLEVAIETEPETHIMPPSRSVQSTVSRPLPDPSLSLESPAPSAALNSIEPMDYTVEDGDGHAEDILPPSDDPAGVTLASAQHHPSEQDGLRSQQRLVSHQPIEATETGILPHIVRDSYQLIEATSRQPFEVVRVDEATSQDPVRALHPHSLQTVRPPTQSKELLPPTGLEPIRSGVTQRADRACRQQTYNTSEPAHSKRNNRQQARPAAPEQTVHVSIGRIEIRATPAPAQPPKPRQVQTGPNLEEYLRQRNRGGGR